MPHQAWCNNDIRIANLYGRKIVAMFCLITSEVPKLEGVPTFEKKICESPKPQL